MIKKIEPIYDVVKNGDFIGKSMNIEKTLLSIIDSLNGEKDSKELRDRIQTYYGPINREEEKCEICKNVKGWHTTTCPNSSYLKDNSTPTESSWEKSFYARFNNDKSYLQLYYHELPNRDSYASSCSEEVKSFISELLFAQKQAIVKDIEKWVEKERGGIYGSSDYADGELDMLRLISTFLSQYNKE